MILKFAMKAQFLSMAMFAVAAASGAVPQYLISTVAGGAAPPTPAQGTTVGFFPVQAVAEDAAGNVYFCTGNWVLKVDAAGILTRVAGGGSTASLGDGGLAVNARLFGPQGLTVDAAGQIYISDTGNHRVRKVGLDGIITTVAGTGEGGNAGDGGLATNAKIYSPYGLAVDAAGDVFFTDWMFNRIRKVTPDGKIATIAGKDGVNFGGDGGPAVNASLHAPNALALDGAGNLYIADSANNRIREITTDGKIKTVAGNGTAAYAGDGGPATSAEIYTPWGVALDANGNLFIADTYNQRIRKVATDGTITTVAGGGSHSEDGVAATTAFIDYPAGVGVSAAGELAIGSMNSKLVRKVSAAGIIATVAGNGSTGRAGDGGPAINAQFAYPTGVAVDAAGNYYIVDQKNQQVRKVGLDGTISTAAGTGDNGNTGDGGQGAAAKLSNPQGVAVDSHGNLYIATTARIRMVATDGTISTVAGNGNGGYSGDGGPALSAGLSYPHGLAVDTAGNIYIADSYNHVIRKVGLDHNISTVAGIPNSAGFSGDGGPAVNAQLNDPFGVAVDGAGNVLIADYSNYRVRKLIVADGTIVTVAGNGTNTDSGDGNPATQASIRNPYGVAVDAGGNIYIPTVGSRVRRVSAADGTITTFAGNGTGGYTGDGGLAASAEINGPNAVALSASGDLYIADSGNNVIRLVAIGGAHAMLGVTMTHATLAPADPAATYTVLVSNAALAGPTSGAVSVTDAVPTGLTLVSMAGAGWSCTANVCTRGDALGEGSSYPAITVTATVTAAVGTEVVNYVSVSGGGSAEAGASDSAIVAVPPVVPVAPMLVSPANNAGGIVLAPVLSWNAAAGATSYDVYFGTSSTPPLVLNTAGTSYTPGALTSGVTYYWQVATHGFASSAVWSFTTGSAAAGLRFVPVTPCRVADTRSGVTMTANSTQSFAVPQSGCGIPATALAYSLNVTVVPKGPLSYLTLWPTGQNRPNVSTLNSFAGDVVANAAIVPAGTGGAVSVYVTNPTDVILDVNGYFDASGGSSALAFYASTPCRVADTRGGTSTFGGPSMQGPVARDFPVPLSGCGIPSTAGGYSLNVTVVPPGYLGYLTAWPTGRTRPNASTLNSWKGKVVANAALVPTGDNESISVFVSNPTNVILDINGYFGQPGQSGALAFYPVPPCRVADTRNASGPFGGPEMAGQSTRSFPIPASACNIPATAAAYSVNVTVVPDGQLQYLSAWPAGSTKPLVSTLNSFDGSVVANAAIVPAGSNGSISVFVTNQTHVILDIDGYFAQ